MGPPVQGGLREMEILYTIGTCVAALGVLGVLATVFRYYAAKLECQTTVANKPHTSTSTPPQQMGSKHSMDSLFSAPAHATGVRSRGHSYEHTHASAHAGAYTLYQRGTSGLSNRDHSSEGSQSAAYGRHSCNSRSEVHKVLMAATDKQVDVTAALLKNAAWDLDRLTSQEQVYRRIYSTGN
mmetsp:Transcript_4052/g.10109  ORF Transcript_4052/g.10109 Transcript_4052/m.10109 type:complete len:182 (-) Transcript_4052:1030-1575(-)|eukprot:CAMPEP_0202879534 /NCGR_PEP_ID=MMETSP1391-20130828/33743_1 /ASSEMBLY_ACC=CAM_ASM_000867 /TAXON_ID=1034604 /ORGANISM="Chlamydomonas leiostraca, Strain SAG 11-49" /LENGTH=181 /DNA_ID=CAMNT_0049561905 /DNA_START=115 /DNA_END=660 /DNA_ORIENTATION=-